MSEKLRELVAELRCMADNLYMNLKAAYVWRPGNFNGPAIEQLFEKWHALAKEVGDFERAALAENPRNLTEHQKAVEEAAGMPLDWGMANASQVAAERPQLSAEQVREFATEYLAFAKYAFGDSRNAWPMSVYHLAEMADALLTGVAEKVPPLTCTNCGRKTWDTANGLCMNCSPDSSAFGRLAPAAPPVLQAPVAQRRTEYVDPLANRLAIYAKQLAEGMRQRVKRNPDVADYLPEFTRLIENFGNEVERKAERAARLDEAKKWRDAIRDMRDYEYLRFKQDRIAELERALADSPVSGEAKEKP